MFLMIMICATINFYKIIICFSFSGVPAVVDFAAMRDAVKRLGGDPGKINPLCPVDLVIDHSVQVDVSRRYSVALTCVIHILEYWKNKL